MTIGPGEKRSLNYSDTEDLITIQSSSDPQDLSKANFFSPVINNGTGTTINYNIQSLFAFFRPFLDAWSGMVGATSTFFNTIKLTHTTIEYVKETTSTTILLINTCNDLTIMNSILHEHVPKCKTSDNITTESTTTTDGTPTTLVPSEEPITSPKPSVTSSVPVGTIDPPIWVTTDTDFGPSVSLTTTETFTQTVQLTTGIVCAKLVNVTGACKFRRSVWLEEPEVLTFNEGMDDVLDSLFTPVLGYNSIASFNFHFSIIYKMLYFIIGLKRQKLLRVRLNIVSLVFRILL